MGSYRATIRRIAPRDRSHPARVDRRVGSAGIEGLPRGVAASGIAEGRDDLEA